MSDRLPPVTARVAFVQALRIRWPKLWRGLHSEVFSSSAPPDLFEWASRQGLGIKDDWLIEAFSQTLSYWTMIPESPDARLEPGHRWFFYQPEIDVPDFRPVLDRPYPVYSAPDDVVRRLQLATTQDESKKLREEVEIESLDDFERRLKKQFNHQLKQYKRRIRKAFVYDDRWQLGAHASWTALALAGFTLVEIACAKEFDRNLNGTGTPWSTVGKAVSRFARYIGLTLPHRLTLGDSLTCSDQKCG